MPCSICAHPEVAAIAAALERGDSLRQVEAAYRVNKSSLSRHTRQCLTAVSVAPQAGNTAPTMGQPTAPAHETPPLAAVHAEAVRLQHAAARVLDIYSIQRVLVSLCELVQRMTAVPTAPAHVVNPEVHRELVRLYDLLVHTGTPVDSRRGLAMVSALLMQVVKDAEEG